MDPSHRACALARSGLYEEEHPIIFDFDPIVTHTNMPNMATVVLATMAYLLQ